MDLWELALIIIIIIVIIIIIIITITGIIIIIVVVIIIIIIISVLAFILITHINVSLYGTIYCTTSFYSVQLTMDDVSSETCLDWLLIN